MTDPSQLASEMPARPTPDSIRNVLSRWVDEFDLHMVDNDLYMSSRSLEVGIAELVVRSALVCDLEVVRARNKNHIRCLITGMPLTEHLLHHHAVRARPLAHYLIEWVAPVSVGQYSVSRSAASRGGPQFTKYEALHLILALKLSLKTTNPQHDKEVVRDAISFDFSREAQSLLDSLDANNFESPDLVTLTRAMIKLDAIVCIATRALNRARTELGEQGETMQFSF